MNEFFKRNLWGIIIIIAGIIGSYAVNSFKISDLDTRTTANTAAIEIMKANNTEQLVKLASVQTTLEYMSKQLDGINKKLFN